MGITNRTLLDIANSIATKINGVNADNVHRPYKSEIINTINMAENSIILDKPQYDFLRKTDIIDGWELAVGETSDRFFYQYDTRSLLAPSLDTTTGSIAYFAEKFVAPAGQVKSPKSVDIAFYSYIDSGKINGQFQAYIVRPVTLNSLDPTQDTNETKDYPDMHNILATSNTINIIDDQVDSAGLATPFSPVNGFCLTTITLTFPVAIPVSNQQKFYVVIKWTAGANCDRQMQMQTVIKSSYTSFQWVNIDYVTTTSIVNGTMNWKLQYNNAVFVAKGIKLPLDCKIPLRIGQPYNGSMGGIFMLPIGTDAIMYRQFNVPPGTFSVVGEDPTTGAKLVNLNTAITIPTTGVPITYPVVSLAANYYVDYIATGGNLIEDTDISVIPQEYRDILVYKSLILLYAMNVGMPESPGNIEQEFIYLLNKMNMNCLPQHSVSISVNTGGYTSAMAATRDTTLSQSLLSMQWPNTWQSTFAAGQNIGQMGGF